MKAIPCSRIAAFASVVVLGLAAFASPAARADIFAATCGPGARSGIQVVTIVNATTGARIELPPNVNTNFHQSHPSISSDGRRLAFLRGGSKFPGVRRELVVVDLASQQSATLLEIPSDPEFQATIPGSSIKPDGSMVFTGQSFPSAGGRAFAQVLISNLPSFPSFQQSTLTTAFDFRDAGSVREVGAGNRSLLAMVVRASGRDQLLLHQIGVGSSLPLSDPNDEYSQPAIAATNSQIVLFRQRRFQIVDGRRVLLPGDIRYRPAAVASFFGEPIGLTGTGGGVNTFEYDESQPAITADGRYVAFVRAVPSNADRLFVWDTQTQTLLNPNGIDLGLANTSEFCGSTSLYTRLVLSSSVIAGSGRVNATLQLASSIGILVQRIVGKTKVLGRKAYELETVGRVPLGAYGAGNVFTHWDFAVNGEPLPPGRYLVTVRAVETIDEGPVARELGEPQVMRVRKNGSIHFRGDDECR